MLEHYGRIAELARVSCEGETHWHGASAMTHIAIQESLGGRAVDWMEHVADAQYPAGGTT